VKSIGTGLHYPIRLEKLPKTWDAGYVGDFATEIQPGFASGQHNVQGAGIPHLRPMNIGRGGKIDLGVVKYVAANINMKRLRVGDILFNNTNSPELVGKTATIVKKDDWAFSNHMTRIVFPETVVMSNFAAYQLHFLWMSGYFLHNCVKHVNQASVSSTALEKSVPFIVPPITEQKLIVAEIEKQFSRLDEAVTALKRIQANLKRYKASVLKAAVEGKLTEQWRSRRGERPTGEQPFAPTKDEPGADLLKRILAERKKKWEEDYVKKYVGVHGHAPKDDSWKKKYKEPVSPNTTNLPKLPSGWMWAMTDQLFFFVTSGSRGWAKYYSNDGPIFLRIGNLDHGTIKLDLTDIQRVKPPQNSEGLRTLVVARDILISITADVGMIGVIPSAFEEAYINQHISLTRPVPSINSLYLAWFLSCKTGQDQFQSQQRGATKLGLGLDDIKSVIVPLPPSAEQNLIVQEIERLFSFTKNIDSIIDINIKRAERLRQSILKKAFSGKLL
jgi:type I restriction enzyme, S subunit